MNWRPAPPSGRRLVIDGVARHMLSAPSRPGTFDLLDSSYDNAGNVVHAEAPFAFWDDGSGAVVDGRELRRRRGITLSETIDFTNRTSSIYVLSAANFIQFGGMSVERRRAYVRLRRALERLEGKLVVLGIGVQAPRRWSPATDSLPSEAIDFMSFLGERCAAISVRGEFSASIFKDYAGVSNTFVTGCPSFFQDPGVFRRLRELSTEGRGGLRLFSLTNADKSAEVELFRRAIVEGTHWIDVSPPRFSVIPENSGAHRLLSGRRGDIEASTLRRFLETGVHRFVDHRTWNDYLSREVDFSYGTRLHANMATLLAGRRALWIAHDSRTIEATNYLHLPAVTLGEALESSYEDLLRAADYEDMFDNLSSRFSRFNEFLDAVGMPRVADAGW